MHFTLLFSGAPFRLLGQITSCFVRRSPLFSFTGCHRWTQLSIVIIITPSSPHLHLLSRRYCPPSLSPPKAHLLHPRQLTPSSTRLLPARSPTFSHLPHLPPNPKTDNARAVWPYNPVACALFYMLHVQQYTGIRASHVKCSSMSHSDDDLQASTKMFEMMRVFKE
ncbi:hypothetical protein C8F04DRAFT_1279182 [Mycena alexandri]|uniref:Uncharacterized protein n=1 Tax=Mycena alexandri TaxID=1745969 RepID=A0AAD6WKT0_9AGAR|nr:hypothetical protein C8F04DRAFT_1279182 [Mycena alexandri]